MSEIGDEKEDIFDRFTDPVKKRKRKTKKDEEECKKRAKMVNMGKKFSKNHFNDPPKPEDIKLWKEFVIKPSPDVSWLKKKLKEAKVEDIEYKPTGRSDSIFCVFDFLAAAAHCTEWLDTQLRSMGWKRNMTGYSPVSASHSTNEVLNATFECFKMAIKQQLRFQEYMAKPQRKKEGLT